MTIERITVIGAGTMGHGIAQVAAQAGYEVVLQDLGDDLVKRGLAKIAENLAKGVSRSKRTKEQMSAALERVRCSTDLAESVAAADLVIEAIVERLDAKRQLF